MDRVGSSNTGGVAQFHPGLRFGFDSSDDEAASYTLSEAYATIRLSSGQLLATIVYVAAVGCSKYPHWLVRQSPSSPTREVRAAKFGPRGPFRTVGMAGTIALMATPRGTVLGRLWQEEGKLASPPRGSTIFAIRLPAWTVRRIEEMSPSACWARRLGVLRELPQLDPLRTGDRRCIRNRFSC